MNISKPAFIALLIVALLLGGVSAYAISSLIPGDGEHDMTPSNQDTAPTEQPAELDATAQTTTDDQAESQAVNGIDIPMRVVDQIKQEYPDYVIDDADREVDDGVVHYEIELEHQDKANGSERELHYDENWNPTAAR